MLIKRDSRNRKIQYQRRDNEYPIKKNGQQCLSYEKSKPS